MTPLLLLAILAQTPPANVPLEPVGPPKIYIITVQEVKPADSSGPRMPAPSGDPNRFAQQPRPGSLPAVTEGNGKGMEWHVQPQPDGLRVLGGDTQQVCGGRRSTQLDFRFRQSNGNQFGYMPPAYDFGGYQPIEPPIYNFPQFAPQSQTELEFAFRRNRLGGFRSGGYGGNGFSYGGNGGFRSGGFGGGGGGVAFSRRGS